MAKLADLVLGIGLSTKQLNRDLGKARKEFRKLGSNFKSLGADLSRNLSLPLAAVGAAALKSAADLERLETSFISLTGGAEQAAKMMEQLNKFTAETPFQIEGVANAAKQLLASGTDISKVNDQLQFLGDIAATGGHRIEDLTAIFAKVNAKGKVELESLNQLAERGIPIFDALAEATGLLPSELGAGAVSVEQFNATLASFAEEGGFAEGAMERLSKTASGQFSTALDALKLAGADLMQDVMPAVTGLINRVTELAQGFMGLSRGTKDWVLVAGTLATALGPLLVMLPQVVASVKMIGAAFTMSNPAVLAATVALTALYVAFGDTSRRASDAAANIKEVTTRLHELNQAELMREAGVTGKLTEEKLLDNILFSQNFVDEAQARIDELEATQKGHEGHLSMAVKLELDDLREFRDEHQRIIDANNILIESLDNVSDAGKKTTDGFVELGHEIKFAGTQFEIFQTPQLLGYLNDFYDHSVEAAGGIQTITDKLEALRDMAGPTFEQMGQDVEGFTLQTTDQLLGFLNNVEVTQEQVVSTTNQTNQAMSALGDQIGNTFGQLIEGSITGDEALRQIAGTIIKTAIAQAIANAVANGASSLSTENQLTAGKSIAGNIAAALAAVMGALVAVPRFAEGGMVFGPGMAMVGDNRNARLDPEVIAPLSKLENIMGGRSTQVYGRISGDDIVISNDRASRDRNRFE